MNTKEDNENEGYQIQRTKNTRNRTKIEVKQVSPGPGETDTSGITPPMAYAKVLARHVNKPPKQKLPEQIEQKIREQGDDTTEQREEDDMNEKNEKLPKDQLEILKTEIRKSSQVVGVKPITNLHIHQETQKIIAAGEYNKNTENDKIRTAAIKNAVFRFLKNELKMDELTRNSLKIQSIYPSQNENSTIYYIQCEEQDDIAQITSRAINLDNASSLREEPSIIPHVPRVLFNRYQAIEKLAYQIRQTDRGKIQTNIRLAKTDYLLRVKYKYDNTPWKAITPIEIPEHIPKPQLSLLKTDNPTSGNNEPSQKSNMINTPPRQNLWDHFLKFQPEGSNSPLDTNQGTISNLLQHTKHNLSPENNEMQNKQKRKSYLTLMRTTLKMRQ